MSDEQSRTSTSKDGIADHRRSLATTAYNEPHAPFSPAGARRSIANAPQQHGDSDNSNVLASPSNLEKLQTYLPTGTWVTYTALQTWAFSLRPDDAATPPSSSCNAHQRIALVIAIALSAAFAFLSSFLKRFVYDAQGTHVLYPPADRFSVAHRVVDPVTRVRFPCRTPERRYCWPLVDRAGGLVYEGARLRVMVFKRGVCVDVRRRVWPVRVWRAYFAPAEDVPAAPRLATAGARASPWGRTLAIDDVVVAAPALRPRWTHTLVGTQGGTAYLDLRAQVWCHALVSVLAFLTLALLSPQVCACLYPATPDYLPSTLQTGMLLVLSFVAAVFVRDDAVGLGRGASARHLRTPGDADVPPHLRGVVETLVWVGRQDFYGGGEKAT